MTSAHAAPHTGNQQRVAAARTPGQVSPLSRDLPKAKPSNPTCGACGEETTYDGVVNALVCTDCRLQFDPETLDAAYLDDDPDLCGKPCENTWHDASYSCGTCLLPQGHATASRFHFTGCERGGVEAPGRK